MKPPLTAARTARRFAGVGGFATHACVNAALALPLPALAAIVLEGLALTITPMAAAAAPAPHFPECPASIAYDETIHCTIDVPTDTDDYTFTAAAGDQVTMDVIRELYEDLARSAPFDGLLFHDDLTLSDREDASPPALAAAISAWRQALGLLP